MKAVIGREYLTSKGCSECNLYLSDQACKPEITRDEFIFYIPYDGCGTRRENNGGVSSFSNTVSSRGTGVNPQFIFICKMEPRAMKELTHNIDEMESTEEGRKQSGLFHMKFLFYDSPSFARQVVSMPYFLKMNRDKNFEVEISNCNRRQIFFVDTCLASPSPHDFTTTTHTLIQNGCVKDYTYTGSYRQRVTRFSFKPNFKWSTVYLQCKIVVCNAYDSRSRCYQGCRPRRKREISSGQEHMQVIGPFKLH
ncbi:deleted in malignant brain tumors 1 protein-like [Lacerta agilis]|uniref:deleted in malignant brain tumors 1 protein-like n=1 Tax=Lacerta agilis TaxID=80427 RepID=UPI001419E910|nr:deleted in malignant brain tumors 1 protein-like [Lacerta agilis]